MSFNGASVVAASVVAVDVGKNKAALAAENDLGRFQRTSQRG
jgi:hypothetical protein